MFERGRKKGFTLVELLVVIAIIGILIALLLPAVQAAREAARRMQCSNKVKQQSLALHNYHDVHKKFPPGKLSVGGGFGGPYFTNWCLAILPFIEQQALHEQYNHNVRNRHDDNRAVNQTVVDTFNCPTDDGPPELRRPASGPCRYDYAHSSYRCIAGRSNGHHNDPNGHGGWWDGAEVSHMIDSRSGWRGVLHLVNMDFGWGGKGGMSLYCEDFGSVKDGTSNTAVIGELHLPEGQARRGTFWAYSYTSYNASGATPYSGSLHAHDWSVCKSAVPTDNICKRGWGAFHPGGFNVGFCDGSVRFVPETVNMEIWCRLASIGGGLQASLDN